MLQHDLFDRCRDPPSKVQQRLPLWFGVPTAGAAEPLAEEAASPGVPTCKASSVRAISKNIAQPMAAHSFFVTSACLASSNMSLNSWYINTHARAHTPYDMLTAYLATIMRHDNL